MAIFHPVLFFFRGLFPAGLNSLSSSPVGGTESGSVLAARSISSSVRASTLLQSVFPLSLRASSVVNFFVAMVASRFEVLVEAVLVRDTFLLARFPRRNDPNPILMPFGVHDEQHPTVRHPNNLVTILTVVTNVEPLDSPFVKEDLRGVCEVDLVLNVVGVVLCFLPFELVVHQDLVLCSKDARSSTHFNAALLC